MKLILSGCNGRMGRVVTEMCARRTDLEIVAGVDANPEKLADYPVYRDIHEFCGAADCIIDFSLPQALESIVDYCTTHKTPAVLATTGYSEEQIHLIANVAKSVAMFRSANMSLGINVLLQLVKTAAQALDESYNIEIVEYHHNQKLDAPSGTALMIADAAASARESSKYVYERHSVRQKRDPAEIGISSVRGGTIVGVHETCFAGHDEILEIKHTALSREIFASGAIKAAIYLANVTQPGLYSMADLVSEMI